MRKLPFQQSIVMCVLEKNHLFVKYISIEKFCLIVDSAFDMASANESKVIFYHFTVSVK